MSSKRNATPIKSIEDSSMTYDESEDMYFRMSQVESSVKGFVSKGDLEKSVYNLRKDLEKGLVGFMKTTYLDNLHIHIEERMEDNGIKIEEWMGNMEDNIERIVKLLQNTEEKLPKGDDVGQGA